MNFQLNETRLICFCHHQNEKIQSIIWGISAWWHKIRTSFYIVEYLLSNRQLKKIIANNAGYQEWTLPSIPPCFFWFGTADEHAFEVAFENGMSNWSACYILEHWIYYFTALQIIRIYQHLNMDFYCYNFTRIPLIMSSKSLQNRCTNKCQ